MISARRRSAGSVGGGNVDPELAWGQSSYTYMVDDTTKPSLTNPYGVSVTYSSSNTNAATIDASTGAITYVGSGTTTLTASFAGNSQYAAQDATCTLRVMIYDELYLTFKATASGTFQYSSAGTGNQLEYSLDSGSTWTTLGYATASPTVSAGNTIMWRGTRTPATSGTYGIGTFSATANFEAYGNTMSLLYGNNFATQKTLAKTYALYKLFAGNTKLTNAENLIFPATACTSNCYAGSLSGCTGLVTAPKILPATTTAGYCYSNMFRGDTKLVTPPQISARTLTGTYTFQYMFYGCSVLASAPGLPATTLTNYCYRYMFYNCKQLTTAPTLPATTLTSNCYYRMFYGCTKLSSITCLATSISASNCTNNWVYNVASSGTFCKATNMSSWTTGNNGIPSNWSVTNWD